MLGFIEKWLSRKIVAKYAEKLFRHALTALGLWLANTDLQVCQILPVCDQLGAVIGAHIDVLTQELVGYVVTFVGLWFSLKNAPAEVVGKEVIKSEARK